VIRKVLLCLIAALAAAPGARAASAPVLPAVGFDESLSAAPAVGPAIAARAALSGIPLIVRLHVSRADITRAGELDLSALDARIATFGPNCRVWVVLDDLPASSEAAAIAPWRRALRPLVEHGRGRLQGIELPLASESRDPALAAYLLKVSAVQIRAADPNVLIALGGVRVADASWLEGVYGAGGAAPYVDVLSLPHSSDAAAAQAARAALDRLDPDARIVETSLPIDPQTAPTAIVRTTLSRLGSEIASTTFSGTPEALAAALAALEPIADLVHGEVVTLDPGGSDLRVSSESPAPLLTRLLYNVGSFSTYLVYWSERDREGVLDFELRLTGEITPVVRTPIGAAVRAPISIDRSAATHVVRARVPVSATPRILDFNYGASTVYALRDEAQGRTSLTVEEIVARHQQVQAAQDDLLDSYVVNARMQQHFRPTAADPGYDVVTDARYYVGRDGTEWEERGFSVNGTKWGPDRPAFPLLQAEKVLSLPLDLRLTADYKYRLTGESTENGRRCYVVAFEPVAKDRSLYRGSVWIDAERFVRLKLQTVQTDLSAPVVSNEEIQRYEPQRDDQGREFWLTTRIDSKQIVLIAGRNLLVEKDVVFSDFAINPRDFVERRHEARVSDRLMYKETDEGLRYFVKENGTRVVSTRMTNSAKAMAMGVTLDPSFDFPLPILGINYLDFEFTNKDTQLAMLFGGVLVLGNVQRGKLFGSALDGSLDLFAIAVPGNDRIYGASGERERERLLTWPFTMGANVGWQADEFQKVTANYQFRFDGYVKDRTTAEDFTVPKSTITNGFGTGYEFRRAGYSFTAAATWYDRLGWRSWGPAGALETGSGQYAKYSASLSKDFYFNVFHKIHLNGAWFGGHNLDRFTRYQFGLFDDTKMHGVPASGIRFADLGMARGSYSFNLLDQYRLDLFLEHAAGRETGAGDPVRHITSIGAAFNLRAPWHTILRADVGKSFLPRAFEGTGSVVVQVLLLKPL
jgi:hypothetical protein